MLRQKNAGTKNNASLPGKTAPNDLKKKRKKWTQKELLFPPCDDGSRLRLGLRHQLLSLFQDCSDLRYIFNRTPSVPNKQ